MTKRTQVLLLTVLAVLMAYGSVPPSAAGQALAWGKAVDGFQMALSFDSARRLPSGAPTLRIRFRNAGNAVPGNRSLMLNLGCGRSEAYRSAILTLLARDSSGKSEKLVDIDLCSGRRDNFQIPMPPGAMYSMPLNFDYRRALAELAMAKGGGSPRGAKGAYTLQAVTTVNVWEEILTVTSNDLPASGSRPSGTGQGEPEWGAPANGLQIAISHGSAADAASGLPPITLWLRNIGAADFGVVLGGGCGCPVPFKDGLVNAVTLNLMDSSGNTKQLRDLGPPCGGCAGAAGIFYVPTAPGAVYSLPLELEYYATITEGGFERGWKPGGTYTLQAVFKSDVNLPGSNPFWNGAVTSKDLEVHFPANRPAQNNARTSPSL